MGTSLNSWELATETALIFDQWMRAIAASLRDEGAGSINQFWILLLASERPRIPVGAAADVLELNYTTTAECAAQLAQAGTIAKTTSEDDGRRSLISLTATGTQRIAAFDQSLMGIAKIALDPLEGEGRIRAMHLLFSACKRRGKKRMMGNLVRGDSTFIMTCQQISIEFGRLCKRQGVSSIQAHAPVHVAQRESISAKELRGHLCLDAPTLSRTLTALADRGLISRQAGASRREVEATPTAIGMQYASLIAEETDALLANLFGDDYGSPAHLQTVAALRTSLEARTGQSA